MVDEGRRRRRVCEDGGVGHMVECGQGRSVLKSILTCGWLRLKRRWIKIAKVRSL
jgi:hypothetical protein